MSAVGQGSLTENEQQPHVDPAVVARVRHLCAALPGTTEKEAWGDPSFRAGGRMYAIVKFGYGQTNLWLAAPDGAQETLIGQDPERFYNPSNHPVHRGWVGLRLDTPPGVDWEEVAFLLSQAHDLVAARTAPRGRGRTR